MHERKKKNPTQLQGLRLCRYNSLKMHSSAALTLMPLLISPRVYSWHKQGTKGTDEWCSRAGNAICVFRTGARFDSAAFPRATPALPLLPSPLCCAGKASPLSAGYSLRGESFLVAVLPLAQGFLSPNHPSLPWVPCVSEGSLRAAVIMVCEKLPRVLPGWCFQRHRRDLCTQHPWK